jgi:copper homeostasis protein
VKKKILLEVCTASLEDSKLAWKHGVDRIELNSALEFGGLTPSYVIAKEVCRKVDIPVIVMIRPRPGDFVYSTSDFEIMKKEIDVFLENGVAGFAFGILNKNETIDEERCIQLILLAAGKECVFHRAFDFVPDPISSCNKLKQIGFKRILTSGQQNTAIEGKRLIKDLINNAGNSIEILPGSGINPSNVIELIESTGCNQIHGSFSKIVNNKAGNYQDHGISRSYKVIDTIILDRMIETIKSYNYKN